MNRKTNADAIPVLIAFKVIALADDLSTVERQVGATLIDSFNRRTGQCDPSLDRVAGLLSVHRRSVIRATEKLEIKGLFRKIRHGGHAHRNHYEPMWSKFIELEARWRDRFSASAHNRRTKMSPPQGPASHHAGGVDATQTCSNNLSKETLAAATPESEPLQQSAEGRKRSGETANATATMQTTNFRAPSRPASSWVASRDAAERRWNSDLMRTYGGEHELLGRIVDAIDADLMLSATDTELRRSGSGLTYVIAELQARDIVLRSSSGASPTASTHVARDV